MKNNDTVTFPLFKIDAFADKPFSGNPAAVCLLEKKADDQWMQSVAAEMNLSETAFVYFVKDGFNLRWFTPTTEVDLCGHATLATAHVLWEQGLLSVEQDARFHTRSGLLIAKQTDDGICMDFPLIPAVECPAPEGLLGSLGINNAKVFFNQTDYLVQLSDESELHSLQPDFVELAKIKARCVVATSVSSQAKYDFISRVFGPASGINEDPVTGSTHCSLTPFWAERLGKTKMRVFQASQRGGELTVELQGDRVLLTGKAVTVLKGELYV